MDPLAFLRFVPDFSSPDVIAAYDELPLWSAMFGLLLLDEVPLARAKVVLDVGCGTGFPLIELAERLGAASHVHGLDPWSRGLARAQEKITARGTSNITLHEGSANAMPFPDAAFNLVASNLGVNNFDDRAGAMQECRRIAKRGLPRERHRPSRFDLQALRLRALGPSRLRPFPPSFPPSSLPPFPSRLPAFPPSRLARLYLLIGIMMCAPGVPGSINHGTPWPFSASSRWLPSDTPIVSGVAPGTDSTHSS